MTYYKTVSICKNFWIGFHNYNNLFDIWFKDEVINKHLCAFSIFENQILAVKYIDTVYVYLINPNGLCAEDAVTLIRAENENGNCELIKFTLNEYLFTVNFNCQITCCGKH